MLEQRGRGPGCGRLWSGAVVVAVACLLTACGHGGSPSPRATGASGSPPSPPRDTATTPAPATPSSGCAAGSATVVHGSGDASVQHLCVRSGTTVTVVLEPRAHGSWPQPRSSNPMLALVTSSTTDRTGVTRVTVRTARIGEVTVTWGAEGAPRFTLRLSVAAYPVQ
ncbi:hypothetical protein [Streptomyces puniciscabiei]|uniref:hypothetical protein n=1 Tax=Streptomyces puniciscabiei TaxID=164348 RepID=UPI0037AB14AB